MSPARLLYCNWLEWASGLSGPSDCDEIRGIANVEDTVAGERARWYRLTPLRRWHLSGQPWEHYLQIGGSPSPEPDTDSPFYDGWPRYPDAVEGRRRTSVLQGAQRQQDNRRGPIARQKNLGTP